MKIMISAENNNANMKFSERFARANYFVIYDTESGDKKLIKNEYKDQASGVGVKIAQFAADNNIDIVISGHFGPKVSDVLKELNIKTIVFDGDTVNEAIEYFKINK